MMFEYPTQRI